MTLNLYISKFVKQSIFILLGLFSSNALFSSGYHAQAEKVLNLQGYGELRLEDKDPFEGKTYKEILEKTFELSPFAVLIALQAEILKKPLVIAPTYENLRKVYLDDSLVIGKNPMYINSAQILYQPITDLSFYVVKKSDLESSRIIPSFQMMQKRIISYPKIQHLRDFLIRLIDASIRPDEAIRGLSGEFIAMDPNFENYFQDKELIEYFLRQAIITHLKKELQGNIYYREDLLLNPERFKSFLEGEYRYFEGTIDHISIGTRLKSDRTLVPMIKKWLSVYETLKTPASSLPITKVPKQAIQPGEREPFRAAVTATAIRPVPALESYEAAMRADAITAMREAAAIRRAAEAAAISPAQISYAPAESPTRPTQVTYTPQYAPVAADNEYISVVSAISAGTWKELDTFYEKVRRDVTSIDETLELEPIQASKRHLTLLGLNIKPVYPLKANKEGLLNVIKEKMKRATEQAFAELLRTYPTITLPAAGYVFFEKFIAAIFDAKKSDAFVKLRDTIRSNFEDELRGLRSNGMISSIEDIYSTYIAHISLGRTTRAEELAGLLEQRLRLPDFRITEKSKFFVTAQWRKPEVQTAVV